MFLKYNGTNIHAMPHIEEDPKRASSGIQAIHWLRPGWNEFPSNIWKLHESNPLTLKMLKEKTIELLNEKVTTIKGKKKITLHIGMDDTPIELKDFTEERAIEIVKGTLNREILQRWRDEENRHKVVRALEEQIKPLLPENQSNKAG